MWFCMLRRLKWTVSAAFLFSLSSSPLFAEQVSATHGQIQPLATSSLLLDIAPVGDALVAVGERGHILLQQPQGWQQVKTPVGSLLTKVFFLNDRLGWAVGHDATILHSTNGGLSWQVQMQSRAMEKPFLDVYFFNRNEGIAVGAYGLFYRTLDGGTTWQEEFHDELLFPEDVDYLNDLKLSDMAMYQSERAFLLPHFNRILPLSDGRLLLVGELGLVAVSDDKGKQFTALDLGYDGSMFNALETSDAVYVMGLRGHVFKADKALKSWQQVPLPVTATINAALLDNKGSFWLVGNSGLVIKLANDGEVLSLNKHQGESLAAIARSAEGQVWLAGTAGLMLLPVSE
ncbi:hypothetical protein NFHSH190041_21180 [Shewanella sp. NFH-SH190041]|uniref:WD40/YVTN/BNR-like repeat-containing protein n=1 Tax=Shewanella sp. NFH-SH190041 TaxID=2950245 RepID=UPI0021C38C8C|nr:YCF48-related protein [Shewanella sp. NFH-SH190041]BDM64666.1 hypothetical protein NFHSH190041_21180 [Shewanella sp. NFH-SH190041]